jgi:amino-acid N-acetyltransferase
MKIDLPLTYSGVRPGEQPDVLRLIADCGLVTEDLSPQLLRDFLVCRRAAQIVGVVGLEIVRPYALLRSLAVDRPARKQGVGKGLVLAAERYARARGVRTLFLLTTTAEPYFASQGYVPARRQDAPDALQKTGEFERFCPDTAVCMHKDL